MKKYSSTVLIAAGILSLAGACNNQPHQIDTQTMSAIQPCLSMGFEPAQCVAAYQQAGRPANNDFNWLGTVAAFSAGAIANHWWNRNSQPTYVYHPEYLQRPDYWNAYRQDSRRQWVTPELRGMNVTPPSYVTQPQPEKNTKTLIPGQQVQPVFSPNHIAPNLANPTQSQAIVNQTAPAKTTQQFQPVQVVPPTKSNQQATPPVNNFKPIQVVPAAKSTAPVINQNTQSAGTFKPIQLTPPAKTSNTTTFKPVQISKPSSSYSSSSKRR